MPSFFSLIKPPKKTFSLSHPKQVETSRPQIRIEESTTISRRLKFFLFKG
jgi:hypothetical protein